MNLWMWWLAAILCSQQNSPPKSAAEIEAEREANSRKARRQAEEDRLARIEYQKQPFLIKLLTLLIMLVSGILPLFLLNFFLTVIFSAGRIESNWDGFFIGTCILIGLYGVLLLCSAFQKKKEGN